MSANWYTNGPINPQPTPPVSPVVGSNEIISEEQNNLIDEASSKMMTREVALQSVARQLKARNQELKLAAVSDHEELRSTADFNETLIERVSELSVFNSCMGVDLAASRARTDAHLRSLHITRWVLFVFVALVGVVGSIISARMR